MCIALLTTAHPKYALIVIDNRDEFVLRPTSQPHWWTPVEEPSNSKKHIADQTYGDQHGKIEVLSSRDLQRPEQGTWFGITRTGKFTVLTNFKETDTTDALHPVHGKRSRGQMTSAWLGSDPATSVDDFVCGMLASGETKGVGGFSLVCGQLLKQPGAKDIEPLAIICNRNDDPDKVPRICGSRGETHGLSNTTFVRKEEAVAPLWPKVRNGERLLTDVIARAAKEDVSEDKLTELLFEVLDNDKLPVGNGMSFEDTIALLRESIFIPPLGDEKHYRHMERARRKANPNGIRHPAKESVDGILASDVEAAVEVLDSEEPEESVNGFTRGLYGTHRQTILLVDWDGKVTYVERPLWTNSGEAIPKGTSDEIFHFQIEGW